MSVMITEDRTLDQLVSFAVGRSYGAYTVDPRYLNSTDIEIDDITDRDLANEYKKILFDQNVVAFVETYSGRHPVPEYEPVETVLIQPSVIQLLKSCLFYEYQILGSDDSAAALEIINKIKTKVIEKLAGFEEAEWG